VVEACSISFRTCRKNGISLRLVIWIIWSCEEWWVDWKSLLSHKHTFASSRRVSRSDDNRLVGTHPNHRQTYLEGAEQALVYAHHCTGIVKLSAVVGGAEQGDELAFGKELVAILDDLMGSADEVHIVLLKEPGHNVWAEGEG
jgi:hypothetical protein